MFSFEPIDKCFYQGIPVGDKDSIEQRFVVRFGIETLDNRLFVVLDKENIRFFYYDNDEQTETLNADYLKEVGYISLNYQKYTGNDILDFPQMSCGEIENLPDAKIANKIIDSFKELFHGFPFLEGKTKNNPNKEKDFWTKIKITIGSVISKFKKKDKKEETESQERVLAFSKLLKCCLLAFVFKIEDRSEVFAQSPLYEHVRDTLRKSDVYQLLSAKIQYTLSVPKDGFVYNSKEYSYKARKFADCLMSQRINKIIPHNNYGNSEGKQGWFYDPEKELDAILEQNRKQEQKGQCKLDENLVLKIRNHLYTKLAVYQAMTKDVGKRYFVCAQILMGITSLMILFSCVCFKTSDTILHQWFPKVLTIGFFIMLLFCLINGKIRIWSKPIIKKRRNKYLKKSKWYYWFNRILICLVSISLVVLTFLILLSIIDTENHIVRYLFYLGIVLCVILWLICSGVYNRNGSSGVRYAFYPRILVAELVGWLTIGIAEDLIKSMLWIDGLSEIIVAIIIVLLIVIILIGGEAKQHSPYKKTWNIICSKTLPIVNHSLFFALFFGLIMQAVFYDNLIKTSNVLSDVVYDDYFEEANYYCQNLLDLEKAGEKYINYCNTAIELKNISMSSESRSKSEFPLSDTSSVLSEMETHQKTNNDSPLDTVLHNSFVRSYNRIVKELKTINEDSDYDILAECNNTLINSMKIKKMKEVFDSVEKKNKIIIIRSQSFLREEIISLRMSEKFNDYETLMLWATVGNDLIAPTGSAYLDSLTINAQKEHKCCRKIKIPCINKPIRIFPTLLIFHTLIVLVLAFVTQLIISDKSVTEPL